METDSTVVMVADSDHNVRKLLGHFLTEFGYSVIFETDGYEALDHARLSPPTIIVADLLLPMLNGLALCRLIKSDSATEKITSVILISVLDSEERALKAGADGFVQKPLEKRRLFEMLDKVATRRKAFA